MCTEAQACRATIILVQILVFVLGFFYDGRMARRKSEDRDVRSLFKMAGGRSYAITLPVDVIRSFKWQEKQKLHLTIDEKKKRIIVEDWPKS